MNQFYRTAGDLRAIGMRAQLLEEVSQRKNSARMGALSTQTA
jgi:hypothetical protein